MKKDESGKQETRKQTRNGSRASRVTRSSDVSPERTSLLSDCHDCGAQPRQPHEDGCDVQRCSVCGGQRLCCDCKGHDRLFARWTGIWPGKAEALYLGIDLNEFAVRGLNRIFHVKPKDKEGRVSASRASVMSSAAETSLSIPSRGRVDHHAVGWICHSDINDAKRCIREANAATLSSALRELALQKNAPNIVRRKLIAIRQRRLKKEAA